MSQPSSILQAFGAQSQGASAARAADITADLQLAKGQEEAQLIRRRGRKEQGAIRVSAAKGGVAMSGSARLALEEAIANNVSDAIQTEYNSRLNARMTRWKGRQAKRAGNLRAAGILMASAEDTVKNMAAGGGGA